MRTLSPVQQRPPVSASASPTSKLSTLTRLGSSRRILVAVTVPHEVVEEAVARVAVVVAAKVVAVVVVMLLEATVLHAVMAHVVLPVAAVAVPVLTLPTTALSQASAANKQPKQTPSRQFRLL